MTARTPMNEAVPRYWMISINEPGKPYARTRLVALDLATAVKKVIDENPGSIIVDANPRGPVNLLAL